MNTFNDRLSNYLKQNFMDQLKNKTQTANSYAFIEMTTTLSEIIDDECIESAKKQISLMWSKFTQMHNYRIDETTSAIELENVEMRVGCSTVAELKAIIYFKYNGNITALKQIYGYGDGSYEHYVRYGNYLVYPKSKE